MKNKIVQIISLTVLLVLGVNLYSQAREEESEFSNDYSEYPSDIRMIIMYEAEWANNLKRAKKDGNLFGTNSTKNLPKEQVLNFLKDYSDYPNEIMRIILYKTGHFTSLSVNIDNNLFGMHCPKNRPTTSINCRETKGYSLAVYKDWKQSIIDFFIWIETNKIIKPIENYRNFYLWLQACGWDITKLLITY